MPYLLRWAWACTLGMLAGVGLAILSVTTLTVTLGLSHPLLPFATVLGIHYVFIGALSVAQFALLRHFGLSPLWVWFSLVGAALAAPFEYGLGLLLPNPGPPLIPPLLVGIAQAMSAGFGLRARATWRWALASTLAAALAWVVIVGGVGQPGIFGPLMIIGGLLGYGALTAHEVKRLLP